ncbi:hypothetical protein NDU88_001465 [Pleurodeles waltl]|uniref:Uncharacterized protein n=1 Tax=Pleurodeles waltl TaxID=8319 RepID=A0AAV7SAW8_PLEWA|nr:hypothetical protein NDU88_001465 [Pleurodeles waltl]
MRRSQSCCAADRGGVPYESTAAPLRLLTQAQRACKPRGGGMGEHLRTSLWPGALAEDHRSPGGPVNHTTGEHRGEAQYGLVVPPAAGWPPKRQWLHTDWRTLAGSGSPASGTPGGMEQAA